MALSFMNPDNDTLLGVDELDIQGLNGVREIILVFHSPDACVVALGGLEISKDGTEWSNEISFEIVPMKQQLFVRPTTSMDGKLTVRGTQ